MLRFNRKSVDPVIVRTLTYTLMDRHTCYLMSKKRRNANRFLDKSSRKILNWRNFIFLLFFDFDEISISIERRRKTQHHLQSFDCNIIRWWIIIARMVSTITVFVDVYFLLWNFPPRLNIVKKFNFRQNKFLKDKKLRDQNNGRLKMKPDMKL